MCLNPFGTGQCLSTDTIERIHKGKVSQSLWNRAMSFDTIICGISLFKAVSIPLEQGNVFRPILRLKIILIRLSQSLWNRAMSFDKHEGWVKA